MILEHALLTVRAKQTEKFENDFREAQKIISNMPGFIEHSLHQHIGDKHQYLLLVKWRRIEDHTQGFRQSQAYQQWRKLLHHYYDPFPTVDYFQPVSGCSRSSQSPPTGDIVLIPAKEDSQWRQASDFLVRCAEPLEEKGAVLWQRETLSVDCLKQAYQLEELFFIKRDNINVGLFFLQNQDTVYWPEKMNDNAVYIHKLVIDPDLVGQGLGAQAVEAIIMRARQLGCDWLRLDCDNRPALNSFYQRCGFEAVDKCVVQNQEVVRYQMLL